MWWSTPDSCATDFPTQAPDSQDCWSRWSYANTRLARRAGLCVCPGQPRLLDPVELREHESRPAQQVAPVPAHAHPVVNGVRRCASVTGPDRARGMGGWAKRPRLLAPVESHEHETCPTRWPVRVTTPALVCNLIPSASPRQPRRSSESRRSKFHPAPRTRPS